MAVILGLYLRPKTSAQKKKEEMGDTKWQNQNGNWTEQNGQKVIPKSRCYDHFALDGLICVHEMAIFMREHIVK